MNFEFEALPHFVRKYALPLSISAVGAVFILIGIASSFLSPQKEEEITFSSESQEESKREIMVDVSGAVVNPGVYRLSKDARFQDALIAAGGLSSEADREWVAKVLNLAAKVSDGGKIYIPEKGSIHSATSGQASTAGNLSSETGLININAASTSQLDTLPGIGPVTANKIIDNRPYTDIAELLSKKVVGQKVFDQIKNSISVY